MLMIHFCKFFLLSTHRPESFVVCSIITPSGEHVVSSTGLRALPLLFHVTSHSPTRSPITAPPGITNKEAEVGKSGYYLSRLNPAT